MTLDLWMMVASLGLCWALIMLAATPGLLESGGLLRSVGNREEAPTPAPWLARTKRATANLQENLVLFVGLVLAAHVSEQADATSALGAEIFVGARVAHAGLYIAGVPWLRTAAWVVSLVGMGLIASTLF